jgi:hypothetical protein
MSRSTRPDVFNCLTASFAAQLIWSSADLLSCLVPKIAQDILRQLENDRQIRVAEVLERFDMDTSTSYAVHTWRLIIGLFLGSHALLEHVFLGSHALLEHVLVQRMMATTAVTSISPSLMYMHID